MKNLKDKKIVYILGGCLVIFVCITICFFMDKNNSKEEILYMENIQNNICENEEEKIESNKIYIHIAGEVCNPGVIEIEEGSRVKDVIALAGGLTENADITKINLAYQVEDGQKITIPNINNTNLDNNNNENYIITGNNASLKININTATQSELESLTGIGPSTASKIIEYRKQNGKFKTIEELKNVTGIGNSKYEQIKNEICVK